jgi:hypothetical protein
MKKNEGILHARKRCGAKTRDGNPCINWGMSNGRCRMHGGKSTGAKTPEGLERIREARTKHGRYSAKAIVERRLIREFFRQNKDLMAELKRFYS